MLPLHVRLLQITAIPRRVTDPEPAPPPLPPAAPSGVAAVAVGPNQINVTWSDNSDDELGFEIFRSASSGSGFTLLNTVGPDEQFYPDTSPAPEETWFYRVRAFNAAGNSADSNEDSATTPAGGEVEGIAAEAFGWGGQTGLRRFTGGIPLKPGQLPSGDTDRIRLFRAGVEQSIAVVALRGKHPDGTPRSVGIQAQFNIANRTPAALVVQIDPAGRGTSDLVWQEPDYALVGNRNAILCTDPVHLCLSYVALVPLQPASQDSPTAAAYFGVQTSQELGEWADWFAIPSTNSKHGIPIGTGATYEHIGALQAAYVRTGDRFHYEWAHERLYDQMKGSNDYYLPGSENGSYDEVTQPDPGIAAGVSSSRTGLPGEAHTNVYHGWATGYLLSAWRQPWRQLAHKSSWAQNSTTNYTSALNKWMGSTYGIRFNQRPALSMLVAYTVEATMRVNGAYGGGRATDRPWVTELPFLPQAWDDDKYDTGTYTDGLTGQRQTALQNCTHDPKVAGHFPIFQAFIISHVAIFYYNNVFPDSRIPPFLQATADFVIQQMYVAGDGRVFSGYEHQPSGYSSGGNAYWIPFFPELFGFVYAFTGNNLYRTWCAHAMNRNCLNGFTKTMKAIGEYFGAHQQSGGYYYDGGAVRGIPGAHPTTITEPTVYTS